MADIAAIFHWSLPELRALTLDELMDWRERAIERLPKPPGAGS
ncbi:MAG: GpE family phage tail protein [Pseudomonadota bacterium]